MSEPEKHIIVLGTVTVEPGESAAFNIPPDASPDAIREALRVAEEQRIAAAKKETARLRAMFLAGDDGKDERR
jgi:uncharacterized small protein (DUF1192 family)